MVNNPRRVQVTRPSRLIFADSRSIVNVTDSSSKKRKSGNHRDCKVDLVRTSSSIS
jgi:hypothetical protein